MRSAILTGATGLLGSWLLKYLSKDYDHIFAIARATNGASAESRVRSVLEVHEHERSTVDSIMSRVTVLDGDIHKKALGLPPQKLDELLENGAEDLFHSAALAEFRVPYDRIYVTNVLGTQNTLDLAISLKRRGQTNPIDFHHISTVAVAGDYEGYFTESDFSHGQHFNNTYEQTKFEAEQLVRDYSQELRTIIYRPSVITGDSQRGITTNFKMLYQPVHFIAYELFGILPGQGECRHSFVPVDRVAEAIALLSKQDDYSKESYQLVNPDQISLEEFVGSICDFFSKQPPRLRPLNEFSKDMLSAVQWRIVEPFVPYFNYRVTFGAEHTNALLRKLGFCWPKVDRAFLFRLYHYCRESGFGRRVVT